MARNSTVTVKEDTYTLLTVNAVTRLRVQNPSNSMVALIGTTGEVTPNSLAGCQWLFARQTLTADMTLDDIWPDQGFDRVFAYCQARVDLEVTHG